MLLYLYSITDADNVINKTLGEPHIISINLRKDVDIQRPQILLRNESGVDFDDFNYAFIDGLDRHYFIDKLGRVNARDNWLYLSCDVLESFKADILQSNARLKRNIKSGDFYDGSIDKSVKTTIMNYDSNVTLPTKVSYILTTVGA